MKFKDGLIYNVLMAIAVFCIAFVVIMMLNYGLHLFFCWGAGATC